MGSDSNSRPAVINVRREMSTDQAQRDVVARLYLDIADAVEVLCTEIRDGTTLDSISRLRAVQQRATLPILVAERMPATVATLAKSNVTDHYTTVDETTCNGTKDYVYTYSTDSKDSYSLKLDSVPDGSVITGISVIPCASLINSTGYGASNLNIFYRFNGVDSQNGALYTLAGTTPKNLTATGFTGLALTKDSLSKLEIGAAFSGFGKKGVLLSRLSTRLTWRTPTPTVQSKLSVSLAPDSPAARIILGGTTTTIASFKFSPVGAKDIELKSLYLAKIASYDVYQQIWFEDASGAVIPITLTGLDNFQFLVQFSNGSFVLHSNDTAGKVLYLKAKLRSPYERAGFPVGIKIEGTADVSARIVGTTTNVPVEFSSPQPTGATHIFYKAYPVFTKLSVSTNQLSNGTRDLFKFSVSAVGGDVALDGFTFDISTTTAKVVPGSLYLYDVTNDNQIQVNETGGSGKFYKTGTVFQTVGYADDWDTNYPADEITVPVSTPHTFVLRGTISGATSGAAVVTGMAGDGALITMRSASNIDTNPDNDFIWSDRSISGHSLNTDDWTNGYLVPGLASTTSTFEVVSF